MTQISAIEGIGETYAQKLADIDISSVETLLERGASANDRAEISSATGISETLILEWVNRADLFRINGIGSQFSDLLEAAGVDSVPELAQRNAQNLYEALKTVNEEKNLTNSLPSVGQIEEYIEQAKSLPKVVTH